MVTLGGMTLDAGWVVINPARRSLRRGLRTILLSRRQIWLAVALLTGLGRDCGVAELIAAVWGDDADGGPLNPANNLWTHVLRLDRQLSILDLAVVWAGYGRGWRMIDLRIAAALP